MGSYAWEIFVCLIESLLITYLLNKKIGLRPDKKGKLVAFIGLVTLILSILTFLNISTNQRIILILVTCILATLWMFECIQRGVWYKAILWPSVYFLIVTLADSITFSIAEVMVDYPLEDLMTFSSARFQFTLIYLMVIAVMIWALTHLSEPNPEFPLPVSLILFVLMGVGIFATESILDISLVVGTNITTAQEAKTLTILSYIILLILVALLITFESLGVILRKNRELRQQQQLNQLDQQQYDLMVSASESLADWKHDYQGQLRLISTLVEQGKYDELKQFSENLDSSLPASACLLFSGNRTMDAVVSLRMMEAKRSGIRFETQLFLPDRIPLSDVALASLVGNMLDNAIEACRKFTPETAEIRFEIKPWKQMMYVFCSNSSDGNYRRGAQGNFLTTKKEASHGIGIRRIQDIVEQTGGTCQFTAENDRFSVSIMIPLEAA